MQAGRQAPDTIAIEPDDYHAQDVGWAENGEQFFLTTPFQPAGPADGGCEYIALYRFDAAGMFLHADIENLGPRVTLDVARRDTIHARLLASLGRRDVRRIEIAPFEVSRFGVQFGLIAREPDEDEDEDDDPYVVEAQPGNYMAFFEPWDSGEYDT